MFKLFVNVDVAVGDEDGNEVGGKVFPVVVEVLFVVFEEGD